MIKKGLSPAVKNGLLMALYTVLVVVGVGSLLFTLMGLKLSEGLPSFLGIGAVALFMAAPFGFIYGWILYHVTVFTSGQFRYRNMAIISGIYNSIGAIFSGNITSIVMAFIVGFGAMYISTKIWKV